MTSLADMALKSGVDRLTAEAAGVMELVVIRPVDALDVIDAAMAGDGDALRVLGAIRQAAEGIDRAPRHRPLLCASCPRPLRNAAFAFVVILPARDNPVQALGLAVCTRCATEPDAIRQKAIGSLRNIWPKLRPITIHPTGGSA